MVKTYGSRFPPSPNLYKVIRSFDKFDKYRFILEVCVPELVSNGTRQDETGRQFLNWRDRDKTTSLWSRCSGKFGKNLGKIQDGTGLLGTTWESLEWS